MHDPSPQNIPGDWNYYPHFTDGERDVHFMLKSRPQVYCGLDLNPALSLTLETVCPSRPQAIFQAENSHQSSYKYQENIQI